MKRTSEDCRIDLENIQQSIFNLTSYKNDLEKQKPIVETIIANITKPKEEIYNLFEDLNKIIELKGVDNRTVKRIIDLYYVDPNKFIETYYSVCDALDKKMVLYKKTMILMKKREIEEMFGDEPTNKPGRKTLANKAMNKYIEFTRNLK